MIENWIDRVVQLWQIGYGKETLLSFGGYEKNDFPETLPNKPCVISYVAGVKTTYGSGGQTIMIWHGISEFHLTTSPSKAQVPFVQSFYKRILTAAMGSMKLGNNDDGIEHFIILPDEYAMQASWSMQYGNEEPHMGLIVHWEVKENCSGQFTFTL